VQKATIGGLNIEKNRQNVQIKCENINSRKAFLTVRNMAILVEKMMINGSENASFAEISTVTRKNFLSEECKMDKNRKYYGRNA